MIMKMMRVILTEMGNEMNEVIERTVRGMDGVVAGTVWGNACKDD